LAIKQLKLKIIASEEAKSLGADLLAGGTVDPVALKNANATTGPKIEMEADPETVNRVQLVEKDLGSKPHGEKKA
jgi:hypothetical protein